VTRSDAPGRRLIADELTELARIEARLKTLKVELAAAVRARGSHLMDLPGIGPAGAARILADVGDVARFPDRNHFASWTGTAPIDAFSGDQIRHRLSRAGNRRLNHVLHIAAVVQLRHDTAGRAYFRRKRAEGKGGLEAMRCLKDASPTPSTGSCSTTPMPATTRRRPRRAREGTAGRVSHPARPT
jgi:transposase